MDYFYLYSAICQLEHVYIWIKYLYWLALLLYFLSDKALLGSESAFLDSHVLSLFHGEGTFIFYQI